MPKYRNKPLVIDAVQLVEGEPWPAGVEYHEKCEAEGAACSLDGRMYVVTIHGDRTPVVYGDWIITEPDGEHFYPCKPDIFATRYELAYPDRAPGAFPEIQTGLTQNFEGERGE